MSRTPHCPRCKAGAMTLIEELEGPELSCLTCGHRQEATRMEMNGNSGPARDLTGVSFEGLIAQIRMTLREVDQDFAATEARLAELREQRKLLERTLRGLSGGGKAAPSVKRTRSSSGGGGAPNLMCKQCGNHRASKAHREACISVAVAS